MTPETMAMLGDKLICLGEALKNTDSTLSQVVFAAWDCGLNLEFRLVPKPIISAAPEQEVVP